MASVGMAAEEDAEAPGPHGDPDGGVKGPERDPRGGAHPNANPEEGSREDAGGGTDPNGDPVEGAGVAPGEHSQCQGASDVSAAPEAESSSFKKPLLPAIALSGPLPRRAKKLPGDAAPTGPGDAGDVAAPSDDRETQQASGPSCRGPARGPSPQQHRPQAAAAEPPLEYTEPAWGGEADDAAVPFGLEVLKAGTVVGSVPLTGASFFVVGRLESCAVRLEHPSVSRRHAVLQHRAHGRPEERGLYLYDLGSTHGSFVNKARVEPRRFHRVRVGHVLRFGGSTRLLLLQGPSEDEEAESVETPTELQEMHRRQRAELERRMLGDDDDDDDDDDQDDGDKESKGHKKWARGGKAAAVKGSSSEDYGCTWGIDMDDADEEEEEEDEENPFAAGFLEEKEAFYLKDPKKALKGFFDREGLELEFEFDQQSHGTWLCRVSLPVEDTSGHEVMAEAVTTGKKKDAMVQCALEACRMLDARGMLRQEAVSRKRKSKDWEEADYYDSDDDSFLDRTGVIEYKRKQRMRKAGRVQDHAETYDSLVAKLSEVERDLEGVDRQLKVAAEVAAREAQAEDSLDAYMSEVRAGATLDSAQRKRLRARAFELRKEQQRLRRLVAVARPAALPPLLPPPPQGVAGTGPAGTGPAGTGPAGTGPAETGPAETGPAGTGEAGDKPKRMLPLTGAMRGGSRLKLKTGAIGGLPVKRPVLPSSLFDTKSAVPKEEEEEDDEEEEEEEELSEEAETRLALGADRRSITRLDEPPSSSKQTHELPSSSTATERPPGTSKRMCAPPILSNPADEPPSSTTLPDESSSAEKAPKRRKTYGQKKSTDTGTSYPQNDPDYHVWVPPTGQTGDGRTHLNDKFGY